MKYIIILFLLMGGNAQAQKDPVIIRQGYSTQHSLPYWAKDTTAVYDTVKRVMLVCDTGFQVRFNYGRDTSTIDTVYLQYVYWQPGYEVREVRCCININNSELAIYTQGAYYIHIEYLDEKRKPLSKSIIVWQSR